MSRTVTILGHDPSLTAWGMALVDVDVDTMEMHPRKVTLQSTAPGKLKGVRVSSDYLVRSRLLATKFREYEKMVHLHAAEIPSGAQSAKAAYAFGLVVGVLSHHARPLIEVTPTEVKKAVTGYAGASKEEIIAWATERYPDLGWLPGKVYLDKYAKNTEHMADALAIVYTAIRTEQFKAAAAMFAAQPAA